MLGVNFCVKQWSYLVAYLLNLVIHIKSARFNFGLERFYHLLTIWILGSEINNTEMHSLKTTCGY